MPINLQVSALIVTVIQTLSCAISANIPIVKELPNVYNALKAIILIIHLNSVLNVIKKLEFQIVDNARVTLVHNAMLITTSKMLVA